MLTLKGMHAWSFFFNVFRNYEGWRYGVHLKHVGIW